MNNKITCVITDDEPFARKGLQGYVDKIDFLQLDATCADCLELDVVLRERKVDVLFLDIQMPHITGIEFLRAITNPPKVVFTTAHEQFALQGFELDVLDYLLKPISFDRFLKTAHKALDYFTLLNPLEVSPYIFVKCNGKLEKVAFAEILYIKGMENYVVIQLTQTQLVVHSTLKSILERLPAHHFLQTHRSYIIAVNKVCTIDGNTIYIGQHQVPLSKYLRDDVLKLLLK
jgi:two-component system LytT family response regulator